MTLAVAAHPGVPGRSKTLGSSGWSSTLVILEESGTLSVFDTGGPGYRAMWPLWLADVGRTVEDVAQVFLTHSHWDHMGAFASFPSARIFIGRDELEWAAGAGRSNPYVEPTLVDGLVCSGRAEAVRDGDRIGAVAVIATPGHTPGHLSYTIDAGGNRLAFVGDAVKDEAELDGGPFSITEDAAASARSRTRLLELEQKGACLFLGHSGWARRGTRGGSGT